MNYEFLIIGQGIAGTWLSYFLKKENRSFLVMDDPKANSASRVAAGIINPVTGRRIVKTWMIEELLFFLVPSYEALGKDLNIPAIVQNKIIDFHTSLQMKTAFEERIKEAGEFLHPAEDPGFFISQFHYEYGYGIIHPGYQVSLKEIIPAWKKKLKAEQQLLEESFNPTLLRASEKSIEYKDIRAEKIIFCDGIASAQHPYFKALPFSLNKGEALLIETEAIPSGFLFKKTLMLAPVSKNLYWAGSNYLWDYDDDQPTESFRLQTESFLKNWLKRPFRIMDHVAAIRPASLERRPFVGFHPRHAAVGILNGLGTKGCSLAPYFAKQMADHLIYHTPILPEAAISRFQKLLSRT